MSWQGRWPYVLIAKCQLKQNCWLCFLLKQSCNGQFQSSEEQHLYLCLTKAPSAAASHWHKHWLHFAVCRVQPSGLFQRWWESGWKSQLNQKSESMVFIWQGKSFLLLLPWELRRSVEHGLNLPKKWCLKLYICFYCYKSKVPEISKAIPSSIIYSKCRHNSMNNKQQILRWPVERNQTLRSK